MLDRSDIAGLHSILLMLMLLVSSSGLCLANDQTDVSLTDVSTDVLPEAKTNGSEARIRNSRWLGTLAVIGYGSLQWDYFSRTPHTSTEGWFEQDSVEGGADKLGHFYTSHVLTALLGHWYEGWGTEHSEAGKHAAISSLLFMTIMEAGDSFSDYGYSKEDMLFNLLGSYAGYRHYVDPDWHRRIDFRVEHSLRSFNDDLLTDYEHLKFLLAVKLDGFDSLQDSPWSWLEVHIGYYARGYDHSAADGSRTAYIGIGLNLSKLFARHGWQRTATTLRYLQPPQTTLGSETALDD